MKRSTTTLIAAPLVASTMLLSGCGSTATQTAATTASSAVAGASSAASAAASDAASSATAPATSTASIECPTENTKSFAKTRFVADLGLAAGTFHRWIYKPYQEGTFAQGADGRTLALVKAAGIAALDIKLLKNASENAKANPTLCKTLAQPLADLTNHLSGLTDKIKAGDLASIATTEGLIQSVLSGSKSNGLPVTETTDQSTVK